MRTKITAVSPHEVKVAFWNGEDVTYWAPSQGGYVRDITVHPGLLGKQVCDGLAYMGTTLMWNPDGGPLVELIRQEYRTLYRRLGK